MRTDLREDPAVIGIAEATGLDEDTVVGKLHRIWSFFDRQSRDGHARNVTLAYIDRRIGVTGFAQAMESEGWLEVDQTGALMPEFGRHNGKSAKTRALAKNRKQASRTERDMCHAPSVTETGQEKRREEKKDPPKPPKGGAVLASIAETIYQEYPRKVGKPKALRAIANALKRKSPSGQRVELFLLERTKKFAEIRKGQNSGLTPHPSTWFNQERYNDDPETWNDSDMAAKRTVCVANPPVTREPPEVTKARLETMQLAYEIEEKRRKKERANGEDAEKPPG